MFRALLSDQFTNIDDINRPDLGIFITNYVSRSMTGEVRPGQYVFDPRQAAIAAQTIDRTRPTILDVEHIDWRDRSGRISLQLILEIFHRATAFAGQIGFTRLWPRCSKKLALSDEDLVDVIEAPYQYSIYAKSLILPNLQFLVAWAHPYGDWEDWERIARNSLLRMQQYHKPVYADFTLSLHPGSEMRSRSLDVEQVAWAIYRLHALGYDGVVLRDCYDINLREGFKEALFNALNQINETVL